MKALNYLYFFTLLIIVISPNLGSIDKLGVQWFSLSILNTFYIILFWFVDRLSLINHTIDFFSKKPVLVYLFFLFSCLLSFIFSINLIESLVTFSHCISLFIIFYCLFIVFEYLNFMHVSKFLSLFFILEVFIAFIFIFINYIHTNSFSFDRNELSFFYGNIIISQFSLLLKLPFFIYYFINSNSRLKYYFLCFILTSHFFILTVSQTRSSFIAYISVFLISFLFLPFSNRSKYFVSISTIFSFLFSVIFFNSRILNLIDSSSLDRLRYYSHTIYQLVETPFFGIGIGAWKIKSIFWDRDNIVDYTVPYAAHNDFLQIFAEIGVFGGLLFLYFFLVLFYHLYNSSKKKNFISLTLLCSLLFYFIDSNLNFPFTRPSLLIFLAIIVSLSLSGFKSKSSYRFLFFLIPLFSIFSIFSSFKEYSSMRDQVFSLSDFRNDNYVTPFETAINFNDTYPNLGVTTIPLPTAKAFYFFNNRDFKKTIELSKSGININPYHPLSDVLVSRSYRKLGILDSSYFYSKQAFNKLVNIETSSLFMLNLELTSRYTELDSVFNLVKDREVDLDWLNYIKINNGANRIKENFKSIIDQAIILFPENQDFKQQKLVFEKGFDLVNKANEYDLIARENFSKANYKLSYANWKMASDLIPTDIAYIQNMASSLVNDGKFEEALDLLFNVSQDRFPNDGKFEFIIANAYNQLGDLGKACQYLQTAINKGHLSSKNLSKIICD